MAARTRLAPTPHWRRPLVAAGSLALVALLALVIGFVALTGNDNTVPAPATLPGGAPAPTPTTAPVVPPATAPVVPPATTGATPPPATAPPATTPPTPPGG